MKLLTKDIEEKLKEYPLGSQDGKLGNSKVIAKFFNPTGVGTWYIIEGKLLENGDAEMFGYCHLGDDELAEFGTVVLSELESIQLPMGMTIERDLYIHKEIDLIYLNFSDPWPKDRHAKRRLTSPRFLERYSKIFRDNNKIIMKTDNIDLFNYSVESLKEYGYNIDYLTNDLHSDKDNIITTEYEDKFTNKGIKINYFEATKEVK